MTFQEHLATGLLANVEFLQNTLADFTDADMLVRPVPNANHTAWQLGHLIVAENQMTNLARPGTLPPLPAGFADKFNAETAKLDAPAAFPTKAQLLDLLARQRQVLAEWAKTLSPADLDAPMPAPMAQFIPTLGALLLMTPTHVAMHMGQMQVVRRKLGKPVMF